jgi:catechol 2,3-dioxygenase-like lactoylglutathione lyase family enzyme
MATIVDDGELFKVALPIPPSLRLWLAHRPSTKLADMTISLSHDHVGLSVAPGALDATIQWYASTLGFIVEKRFDVHGQTFAFIVRDGVKIELVTGAAEPHTAMPDSIATSHTIERLHHFCVAVEDLDAIVAQVSDRGVPLIGGPMEVPVIGQRIAFITDNLGNIIEFTEPATRRS